MGEITIPELTEEQRTLIVLQYQEERRKKLREHPDHPLANTVKKLYLLTFSGHCLALPDKDGAAVHHQCVYAWVERKEGDVLGFFGGEVEVVAKGDGRWLQPSFRAVLNGSSITALVEVEPEILRDY